MDAAEFERLIEIHQRMVFSLALRVTGEYGAAEEVAQDAFLELFRTGETFANEDHVRFWLRRATVHRSIDEVGEGAAYAMIDLIEGRDPVVRLSSATLAIRESTMPLHS